MASYFNRASRSLVNCGLTSEAGRQPAGAAAFKIPRRVFKVGLMEGNGWLLLSFLFNDKPRKYSSSRDGSGVSRCGWLHPDWTNWIDLIGRANPGERRRFRQAEAIWDQIGIFRAFLGSFAFATDGDDA